MVPDHTGGAHPTTCGRFVSVPASGACSTMRVRDDVGWRWKVDNGLETSASCASTSGTEQLRHFLIELLRDEVDPRNRQVPIS